MWIMLSDSFLSIVHKDCKPDELLVRARRKGDVERVFPHAKVIRTPGNDYLFRAVLKRDEVVAAIANRLNTLGYGNYKSSVKNRPFHNALSRVWSIMAGLQTSAPYSGVRRGRRDLFEEMH